MKINKIIDTKINTVGKLVFDPKTNSIIGLMIGSGIKTWSLLTGELTRELDTNSSSVSNFGLSNDGNMLISADNDGIIKIFIFQNNDWLLDKHIVAKKGRSLDVIINHNNSQFLRTNSTELIIEHWNIVTNELQKNYSFGSCDFHPQKALIAMWKNKFIILNDYESDQTQRKIYVGEDIARVSFSHDGSCLITSNASGEVIIWNLKNNKTTIVSKASDFVRYSVSSSGTNIFASLYESGAICTYELPTGRLLKQGHSSFYQPNCMDISPKGNMIALSGSKIDGRYIEIWDF